MKVLLITDQTTQKSAASMVVGVGKAKINGTCFSQNVCPIQKNSATFTKIEFWLFKTEMLKQIRYKNVNSKAKNEPTLSNHKQSSENSVYSFLGRM